MPLFIIIQSIVQEGNASPRAVSSLQGKNWFLGGEKFLCLYSSLGYIPRSGIAGSYGHFMVNSLKVEVIHSCLTLCDPIEPKEFSRPEYWSGEPFPSPGDLPNPGIKPRSPALQADSLLSEPPGKIKNFISIS